MAGTEEDFNSRIPSQAQPIDQDTLMNSDSNDSTTKTALNSVSSRKRRRLRRGTHSQSLDVNPQSLTQNRHSLNDALTQEQQTLNTQDEEPLTNTLPQDQEIDQTEEVITEEFDVTETERMYFSQDEEEEGEDLLENAENDYRPMDTLDQYDPEQLDAREYDAMDYDTRQQVEQVLNRRDAREGRVAQMFQDDQETEYDDTHRHRLRKPFADEMEIPLEDEIINLENFDVPLREWIASERPRNEIKRRFRYFLNSFKDKKNRLLYHEKLVQMAQKNEQSLDIEIGDIIQQMSMIAAWIVEAPREMFSILDEVAKSVMLSLFPYYDTIHDEIHVRILDLPGTERLRDLRTAHLNFLIKVSGVVTRRTSIFPQLKLVKLNCTACGALIGPFTQHQQEIQISSCPECHCKSRFFPINMERTVFRNYQRITLQESPSSVPPGRVPRSKDVILLADLIDQARPGDEIAVTGVYCNVPSPSLYNRDNFPVFQTVIEANHVERRASVLGQHSLTMEDKKRILKLAKSPNIAQSIIRSMAPSIFGHWHVKTAIALALFGGKPKFVKNSRIRGDINVLLVGDPGTAKSQFLKFVKTTAPRAVYSTGKGASAVGLTAAVTRDPFTKEWVLQGGALVLADKGVCLIDEFDKMNEQDRTSIHEAMEQQSISISKAGIVTSLQARCSVMAAANPINGRYDPTRTFSENVELTDPILQRFDVLCVLQDQVDPVNDERLADFVISSHMRCNARRNDNEMDTIEENARGVAGLHIDESGNSQTDLVLDTELLRKYLLYARMFVDPVVSNDVDTRKVETFYAQLRKASQHTGAVPIAVRHIESLFRMAEAHARMHLREFVVNEDIDVAIRVMTESLCAAQKFTFQRQWRRLFRRYLTHREDSNLLILHILQELIQSAYTYHQLQSRTERGAMDRPKTQEIRVACSDLASKAKIAGIYDIAEFYESSLFVKQGFRLGPTGNYIVKDL